MKNIDIEGIGMRIQQIRSNKNMTQDKLAEIVESDRRVIARIESGKQGCSLEYLIKIANALEVTTDTLLLDSLDYPHMTAEELEVNQLLADCTTEETTILIRTLNSLKSILKGYTIK